MSQNPSIPNANWNYPTRVNFGAGRIDELPAICRGSGIERPLVITDPGLAKLPFVSKMINATRKAGLGTGRFNDVKPNPNGQNVIDGVQALQMGSHDGVIAVGGGSAVDVAKAVAFMADQELPLWDFEDVDDNYLQAKIETILPIVAVPTTAGTGSEVGRASVILDEDAGVKRIIFHPLMLPTAVIADPELTVGLPTDLTAATGMDALSHNLEAFCARGFHPMADGIALEGMRLIWDALPRAVADGTDLDARAKMLAASMMGATAFQKGLGLMHALSHPLSATHDTHHGLANGVLMPYVLAFNSAEVDEPLSRLARCLRLPSQGPAGVLDWVLKLREAIGIPHTLGDLGVTEGEVTELAAKAVVDPAGFGNPKDYDLETIAGIYRRAIKGELS